MQTFKERQNATAMDTTPAITKHKLGSVKPIPPDGWRCRGTIATRPGMEKEGNNTFDGTKQALSDEAEVS